MARPKEFDRQDALDRAMALFWERGYEATTMTDLRHAIGIGRQSLYDTFGDKDQLFSEALGQYVKRNDSDVKRRLRSDAGLKGIRSLLDSRVQMLTSGKRRGCLMINSCVELSQHDKAIGSQIRKGLSTLKKGFESALIGAMELGEISDDVNVSQLADFLLAQVTGLVVMAKNGASRKELQASSDLAIRTLTFV